MRVCLQHNDGCVIMYGLSKGVYVVHGDRSPFGGGGCNWMKKSKLLMISGLGLLASSTLVNIVNDMVSEVLPLVKRFRSAPHFGDPKVSSIRS